MPQTDRLSLPALTSKQRRYLRGLAHGLSAVVHVGKQGFTPALRSQLETALEHHELIKVRLGVERSERPVLATMLADVTAAEYVGSIGRVVILYRRRADAERQSIVLPA